jgi:hypothetical protein
MMHTNPFDDDKLHEECGVFGIYGHPESAAMAALGLHALQHRGQEAAGIVSYDGEDFFTHKAMGLVDATFSKKKIIEQLKGYAAIGHNRYSTTGEASLRNVQPIFADLALGGFAVAHNGNLTNAATIREELVKKGSLFQSTSDTEVIVHLMATSQKEDAVAKLIDAVNQIQGAYSLVAVTEDMLIGVRDPFGIRPLVLGQLAGAKILTSETCALDIIGADFVINPACARSSHLKKQALASAFLNMFILRVRILLWKAVLFTKHVKISVLSLQKKAQCSMPMWSCLCQTLVCHPQSVILRHPVCRLNSASSVTIMSAAPLLNRRRRSATWV